MYHGSSVELEMKKMLLAGAGKEENVFQCKILEYDAGQERIYLILEDAKLSEISLDAVYECRIKTKEGLRVGEGRIRQRYYNEAGKILELQIENGFYKNSIKSVDKRETE